MNRKIICMIAMIAALVAVTSVLVFSEDDHAEGTKPVTLTAITGTAVEVRWGTTYPYMKFVI